MRLLIGITLLVTGSTGTARALGDGDVPYFVGLGDLPGGTFDSSASGVSADGTFVVGSSDSAQGREGFRWTLSTGIISLGASTAASSVSGDGSVITGTFYPTGASPGQAFRWTEADGVAGLGYLPDSDVSSGSHVSADGTVIVGSSDLEAFRWTEEDGMEGLGYLPGGGDHSFASATSADGSIVVGGSDSVASGGHLEAYRWVGGEGIVGLGGFAGYVTYDNYATDVSANGSVIVGNSSTETETWNEAFRWTADDGMVSLGILPGTIYSLATAVSADGSVIVGSSGSSTSVREAFIWDVAHGMRSLSDVLTSYYGLDLSGWTIERAWDVSADGRAIVGQGINPDGFYEAYIAHIPEPNMLALLIVGVAISTLRRCALH